MNKTIAQVHNGSFKKKKKSCLMLQFVQQGKPDTCIYSMQIHVEL